MKTILKHAAIVFLSLALFNCSSDDDNNNDTLQNPLLGKWEAVSGSLLDGFIPNYIIFNVDDSANLLIERSLGFKNNLETDYSTSGSELTINLQGNINYQYSIDGETLTITGSTSNTAQFQKNNNAPNVNDWVQELSVLNQGDAPWDGVVDIAFTYDKTQILYGMNASATYIPLINPQTFEEVGQIASASEARIVEIEKFDVPDRYLFQSSGNSDLITYYTMNDGMVAGNIEIAAEITGLASVNETQLWLSNNDDRILYLYNYASETLDNEIDIGIGTFGLDYQNGYLYISDSVSLHKCQTSPDFQVLESYSIPDTEIFGIAFDGVNFWVSGYDYSVNNYQLIKTNLTL